MISIHRFPFLYFKFNSCKMKFLQEPLRVMPKTIRNFSMRRHIGGSVTFKGPKLAHQTEADVRHVLPEHTSTFRRPSKFSRQILVSFLILRNAQKEYKSARIRRRLPLTDTLYAARFFISEKTICATTSSNSEYAVPFIFSLRAHFFGTG